MMSRQFQITAAPLWKLAGFALLVLSFSFTAWMLGHAITALDHLIDAAVEFFQAHMPTLRPRAASIFEH